MIYTRIYWDFLKFLRSILLYMRQPWSTFYSRTMSGIKIRIKKQQNHIAGGDSAIVSASFYFGKHRTGKYWRCHCLIWPTTIWGWFYMSNSTNIRVRNISNERFMHINWVDTILNWTSLSERKLSLYTILIVTKHNISNIHFISLNTRQA